MIIDNRDLVLKGLFGVLPAHLEPYVRSSLGDQCTPARLRSLLSGSGAPGDVPDLADLSTQIRILTARGSDGRYLMPLPAGLGSKLHEVRQFRNRAVHGENFDSDTALAALVAIAETLRMIGAEAGRGEIRELIDALDGGRGAHREPLEAVDVDVDCGTTVSYAHAAAGQRFTVSISLGCKARPGGLAGVPEPPGDRHSDERSRAERQLGTVKVRIVLVEEGGGRVVTEPWDLVWDTGAGDLRATGDLRTDRAALLQVEQVGTTHIRVELANGDGARTVRRAGPTVLPPRQWRLEDHRPSACAALATFVQPGQAACAELVRRARQRASSPAGRSTVAPGPDALAASACAVLRRLRIAVGPAAQWTEPQTVRSAAAVLDLREASRLDMAVLIAGVLENLGCAPILLLTPSTVLLGYSRGQDGSVPHSPHEVINLVESGEWGVIDPEHAVAVHQPGGQVRRTLLSALSELLLVVPIEEARSNGALPQPALDRDEDAVVEVAAAPAPQEEEAATPTPAGPTPAGPTPAQGGPGPGGDATPTPATPMPAGRAAESASTTAPQAKGAATAPAAVPGGAVPRHVEDWKKDLLDLSLRNPLINVASSRVIKLEVAPQSLGELEDMVNDRQLIALHPRAHGAERTGEATPNGQGIEPASLLTEQRAVRVDLNRAEYAQRLQSVAANARTTVEETGANNLYLTLGTLVWRTGGRLLRSPLVLVPVVLERTGEGYGLQLDETGVSTPNYSLLTRFAAETGIELAELREPVRDEHGIDIETTLAQVDSRLRHCGHEVRIERNARLGMFQFSTYRMWRDLEDSWPTIVSNPLVGHLMNAPESSPGSVTLPAENEPDINDVVENLPLMADAAQARVVADAVAGRNLVVEGPPGTGKSQTVANLIFRALATGKTVMFVAEKTSALDVVARRLREETGIGDLLLNLHDNGVKAAEVRRTLRRADDLTEAGAGSSKGELETLRERLAVIRGQLDTYRNALHGSGRRGHSYYRARQAFIEARDEGRPEAEQLRADFEAVARECGLDGFDPERHAELLEDYRTTQERLHTALTGELVASVLARRDRLFRGEHSRVEDLRRELGLRKATMSVREFFAAYGDLITALTPCLLVSPDSVARFLPPDGPYVDIVVFDEASQITVANAVGAMGRGRSAVVVGDPQQMPPAAVAGAARGEAHEGMAHPDRVSILDRCIAAGVATRRLTWHFRSQVESLIAFSNARYYDGALLSFPSPLIMGAQGDDGLSGHGISLRRVKGTYYSERSASKGRRVKPNTNPHEAYQIVEEVVRRFEASPHKTPSLGVITFNKNQRDLIENRLREKGSQRIITSLEERDGLMVRNLDNVQGQERDTILLSTTVSANERGDIPLNFGSLSHAGGERRLNVAITRARRQIIVFSSFDPEDLHVDRTTHQGLKDLRDYLMVARDGSAPRALPVSRGVVDRHRNEIAESLRDAGLQVNVGVGHSSFEVDLVLADPQRGTPPKVAVLLDGPGWNQRGSTTDRDLLPVSVLRSMGWSRIERIWMPQWVADQRGVVTSLVEAVGSSPLPQAPQGSADDVPARRRPAKTDPAPAGNVTDHEAAPEGTVKPAEGTVKPAWSVPSATEYRPWPAEALHPVSELDRACTDEDARAKVIDIARSICGVEAPLTRHRLIVKICRTFSLQRTTASREASVRRILGEAFAYIDECDFVWRSMDSRRIAPAYRRNALDHVDSISEIHPDELTALMAEILADSPGQLSKEELCLKALRRLSAKKRKLSARGVLPALSEALERAQAHRDSAGRASGDA